MIKPGYRSFLAVDPTTYLEKVSCAVFAIHGENDLQVPAEKTSTPLKRRWKEGEIIVWKQKYTRG